MDKNRWLRPQLISIFALIVFLIGLPLFVKAPYLLHVLIMINIFLLVTVGLFVVSSSGHISFCQGAFMGIGAYASTLFVMKLGYSFWVGLLAAGVAASIVALIIGYPSLKVRGTYFLLVTFAFAEIARLGFTRLKFLGGAAGIRAIPGPDPILLPYLPEIAFSSRQSFYWLSLLLMLLGVMGLYWLYSTRVGLTVRAIRDASPLAESIGINIMKYKILVFAIAAFSAGIAGSLYAHYIGFICPADFSFWLSTWPVVYIAVGSLSSFAGPILGTIFLSIAGEALYPLGFYKELSFGLLLIVVSVFFQGGLVALFKRLFGFSTRWLSAERS